MKLNKFAPGLFAGLAVAAVVACASSATAAPATPVAHAAAQTATRTFTVPAYCAGSTAITRTYPINAAPGQNLWRSGEHAHGAIRCIIFSTSSYIKVQVIDQATGGYVMDENGITFWYNDCSQGGERWSATGEPDNDCSEAWKSDPSAPWVYPGTDGGTAGAPMIPALTPVGS